MSPLSPSLPPEIFSLDDNSSTWFWEGIHIQFAECSSSLVSDALMYFLCWPPPFQKILWSPIYCSSQAPTLSSRFGSKLVYFWVTDLLFTCVSGYPDSTTNSTGTNLVLYLLSKLWLPWCPLSLLFSPPSSLSPVLSSSPFFISLPSCEVLLILFLDCLSYQFIPTYFIFPI